MMWNRLKLDAFKRTDNESDVHAKAKRLIAQEQPLEGVYVIDSGLRGHENTVTTTKVGLGPHYPDVLVEQDRATRIPRGVTIEAVNENTKQKYYRKSKESLKRGYPICWVFNVNSPEKRQKAWEELGPWLTENVQFGVFDVSADSPTLDLGTPIWFDNFYYQVDLNTDQSLDDEIIPETIDSRMWEMNETAKGDWCVGTFEVRGEEIALFVSWDGGEISVHPSDYGSVDSGDLFDAIWEDELRRVGPIGGRIPRDRPPRTYLE